MRARAARATWSEAQRDALRLLGGVVTGDHVLERLQAQLGDGLLLQRERWQLVVRAGPLHVIPRRGVMWVVCAGASGRSGIVSCGGRRRALSQLDRDADARIRKSFAPVVRCLEADHDRPSHLDADRIFIVSLIVSLIASPIASLIFSLARAAPGSLARAGRDAGRRARSRPRGRRGHVLY